MDFPKGKVVRKIGILSRGMEIKKFHLYEIDKNPQRFQAIACAERKIQWKPLYSI
jgi:hypothetical protein